MTQRTAFVLSVRPDKIDEYVHAHQEVWPEMLDALRGRGNPQLHDLPRTATEMFGYFEADDLDAAARPPRAAGGLDALAGRDGRAARGACPGRGPAAARGGLPARLRAGRAAARRGLPTAGERVHTASPQGKSSFDR